MKHSWPTFEHRVSQVMCFIYSLPTIRDIDKFVTKKIATLTLPIGALLLFDFVGCHDENWNKKCRQAASALLIEALK